MVSFIKRNRYLITIVFLVILSSIIYKFYKIDYEKKNKITKEVVTLYLKNNEIKDGIVEKVDEYNKSHEDIYIRLRLTNDDYDNIVHTKLANQYDIDIFEYNGKTLIEKDFIKPLSSIGVDLSNIKDDSFMKYNDEIIGVKYGSAMEKLMYNKDILSKANIDLNTEIKDLDSLIKVLEKIKKEDNNIIPLDLSLKAVHDLFSILGTMTTSENTTYSTFWNYKTGEYDYDGLKEVLTKFNYMYKNNLINQDFDTKLQEDLFDDFKEGKSAITPVNFYQKYSVMDRLQGMNIDFTNIPFNKEGGRLYYYTYSRTLVLANNDRTNNGKSDEEIDKHNKAVKEVFEWLISDETTNDLVEKDYNFASFNYEYKEKDMYSGMNNNIGYIQPKEDPTEVLAGNSDMLRKAIYSMIKGEIDINTGIEKLKEDMNNFIKNNVRNKDVDLDKYKE